MGVPGVERILDHLTLANPIRPVQAEEKPEDIEAKPKAESKVPIDEPQPEFTAPAPQPSDAAQTGRPISNSARVRKTTIFRSISGCLPARSTPAPSRPTPPPASAPHFPSWKAS